MFLRDPPFTLFFYFGRILLVYKQMWFFWHSCPLVSMGDWFQSPLWILQTEDAQVSHSIKCHSICTEPVHILSYILNPLWITYYTQFYVSAMEIIVALFYIGNNNKKKSAHVNHKYNFFLLISSVQSSSVCRCAIYEYTRPTVFCEWVFPLSCAEGTYCFMVCWHRGADKNPTFICYWVSKTPMLRCKRII